MTEEQSELTKLADLIEQADLVVLHVGGKKAGLGADLQERIVAALRLIAAVRSAKRGESSSGGDHDDEEEGKEVGVRAGQA